MITAERYQWKPIDTIEQFKDSSMKYLARKDAGDNVLFQNDETMDKRIQYIPYDDAKSFYYNTLKKPLAMLIENPKDFVIIRVDMEDWINYYYTDVNGEHDFHVSKETVSSVILGFYFAKGKLYLEAFNVQMMKMWEVGIMQHWNDMLAFKFKLKCIKMAKDNNRQPKAKSDKILVVHLTVGFVILGCGFTLAVSVLILSILQERNENRF